MPKSHFKLEDLNLLLILIVKVAYNLSLKLYSRTINQFHHSVQNGQICLAELQLIMLVPIGFRVLPG